MSLFGATDHTGQPAVIVPLTRYPKQKAWSYSSVQQHNTCPQVIRFRKIDRLEEPKSIHLTRGLDVHGAVESAINGVTDIVRGATWPFPPEWLTLFTSLRLAGAITEAKLAFTREWKLTGYFAPDVWLRVVLDAIIVDDGCDHVTIWEWKTGKQYEDHKKQGRLYALAGLLIYPHATIDVRIRYLDRYPEGHDILNFTPAALPSLKQEFTEFSNDFLNDEIYPARPNRFCGNCHFRASNGGPCVYG